MFKLRKRVLIAILAVVFFFIGLTAYINLILIPVQLRHLLIKKTEEFLNRSVSLEEINFSWNRGLVLHGLRVSESDSAESTMLKADEIALNFLFINFFIKKQIIIPSARISGLEAHLSRASSGQWNFTDLLNRPTGKESSKENGWTVLVRKIILEKSAVRLRDASIQPALEESVEDITAEAAISLKPSIQFALSLLIPSEKTSLTINGMYLLKDKKLSSEISLQSLALEKYASLLPAAISAIYHHGTINRLDASLQSSPTEQIIQGTADVQKMQIKFGDNIVGGDFALNNGSLTVSSDGFSGKGQLTVTNLQASLNQNQTLSGELLADLTSLEFRNQKVQLQAGLTLNNGEWKNQDGTTVAGDFVFDKVTLAGTPEFYTGGGQLTANNLNAKIGTDITASGTLAVNNLAFTNKESAWDIKTDARLTSANLKLTDQQSVQGDFILPETTIRYFSPKITITGHPEWQNASANFGPNRSYRGSVKLTALSAVSEGKKWNIETAGHLSADTLTIDGKKFTGTPDIKLSASYGIEEKKLLDYAGSLTFHNAEFVGIPVVERINSMAGNLTFSPDHVETDLLKLTTMDTPILIKGHVENFLNPRGDLEISSENVILKRIVESFPELTKKFDYQMDGTAAVQTHYRGLLNDPKKAEITAAVNLKDASIAGGNIPGDGIRNIIGLIHYSKDLASWKELSGNFAGKTYMLNGQISNFSKPVVDTSLNSDGFKLTTQLNILNKAFQIISLNGQYLQSTFDIKGDVRLQDASGPRLDLRFTSQVNLDDLSNFPQLKEKMAPAAPKGTLEITGLFRGIPEQWRDWQVVLDAKSPKVLLYKYPVENLSIHLEQRDKFISQFTLISNIYSGALDIKGSADLGDPLVLLDGKLLLQNLNLSQLAKNQNLKVNDLQGDLSLAVSLKGPALDQNAWEGGGAATISNGYLGQWGLLKGIFGTLMIIDEFKTVYVTDASANFLIRNKKVSTENLLLNSKIATLTGRGWIGFDQKLEFDISPTLSEIVLAQSESLKKNATAFISQVGNVQCSGTLTQPNCQLEKSPLKIIGTTTDIIKEGVQGILQEIF